MSNDDTPQDPVGLEAPTHTQTPNSLFDKLMMDMGESELKVVLCAIRKTFGYHKRRDPISLTQFQRMTGLSRQGVLDGIERAVKRGILIPVGLGIRNVTIYELNVTGQQNGLVKKDDQSKSLTRTSQQSRPELVNKVDTQKKGSKENKQKKKDIAPATQDALPQVTVITSKFPYRDTVASSLTIGTARALDIVHILQGTSKKYAACNCIPPVSEDEFKACMVWRNGKFIPQKAETVQNMIAEWRVSNAYRNWQNRQSAPIQADDESSADEQSLSYQERMKQNLLYGAMATGGNNGNAG